MGDEQVQSGEQGFREIIASASEESVIRFAEWARAGSIIVRADPLEDPEAFSAELTELVIFKSSKDILDRLSLACEELTYALEDAEEDDKESIVESIGNIESISESIMNRESEEDEEFEEEED